MVAFRKVALAFLIVYAFAPALGAQNRSSKDLSGTWDFRFDPEDIGEAQSWFRPDDQNKWQTAKVPGSYNEEFAEHPLTPELTDAKRFYKGATWYRRTFDVALQPGTDQILHLAGTVLRQKVWVNGELAGESVIPYMDVAYTITSLLRTGQNTVVIEVDNRPLQRSIPDAKWRGWWDDGGLIRPVTLETRPQTHADTHYTTKLQSDGSWKLEIKSHVLQHPGDHAQLDYTLRDAAGKEIWHAHQAPSTSAHEADLATSASLNHVAAWSPDHPNLYRLEVRTTTAGATPVDVDVLHVGFREVKVDHSRVLLNGEPLQLRGIDRHEFLAGSGMSLTPAQNRADIADIKHMGANFTRLAHYSQSQDVYDACDELGLLVWTEIPAWQSAVETLADPNVWEHDALPQLRGMVEQHRNHPSVIIYSVANEIPTDKPDGAHYVEKAVDYVHALDASRLTTFASDKRDRDLALNAVDVIAVNEYFGRYYGGLQDVGPMLDTMHKLYPDKPIMVSEYGSEGVPGWTKDLAKPDKQGVTRDYSVEYQARFMTAHMEQIYAPARQGFVLGGSMWVYADFPDPHRVGGDHPDMAKFRNNKGLMTMDRKPKPAYAAVEGSFHRLEARAQATAGTSQQWRDGKGQRQ